MASSPPAPPSGSDQHLRTALAVAIVAGKRRAAAEAEAWRAKAASLEAELAQSRSSAGQLEAWAASLLSTNAAPDLAAAAGDAPPLQTCLFLPPLELGSSAAAAEPAVPCAMHSSYAGLQQQLTTASQARRGGEAVRLVLEGRAALLSQMLLTNASMLVRLQQPAHLLAPAAGRSSSTSTSAALECADGSPQPGATDSLSGTAAVLSSFVLGTLLAVPRSSLQLAYMQHSAALLAALLAQQPCGEQAQPSAAAVGPGRPLAQQACARAAADAPEAVAGEVVQLMWQLLEARGCLQEVNDARGVAATEMLQQLSSLPGTALLMALAVTQQLQAHMDGLAAANSTAASLSLASVANGAGAAALQQAAGLFQGSHTLLQELDTAVAQLPAWCVALAGCGWTCQALEDLVTACSRLFASSHGLQARQPLLAGGVCQLAARLATTLQHVATSSDAPGMRAGQGAAVRAHVGQLCMRLRDAFMPGPPAAAP